MLQDILMIGNKHGVNIMTTMSMMRNNNKQKKNKSEESDIGEYFIEPCTLIWLTGTYLYQQYVSSVS